MNILNFCDSFQSDSVLLLPLSDGVEQVVLLPRGLLPGLACARHQVPGRWGAGGDARLRGGEWRHFVRLLLILVVRMLVLVELLLVGVVSTLVVAPVECSWRVAGTEHGVG